MLFIDREHFATYGTYFRNMKPYDGRKMKTTQGLPQAAPKNKSKLTNQMQAILKMIG